MARERAERPSDATTAQSQATLNVAVVHQLVTLMSSGDIEEITIEAPAEGVHLTLKKPAPAVIGLSELGAEYADEMDGGADRAAAQPTNLEVGAPLVGIFRASMKPGGKPLVTVGSTVREGQVVAAIEALQVFNEVEASAAGTVREILVDEGQAVEYGQPLFVVEPHRA